MAFATYSRRSFIGLAAATLGSTALPALSLADEAALFSAPGTYSASAPGRNADVTVTATFSSNAIDAIEVAEEETETIGSAAISSLIDTVLTNQSLAVEAVSGATISSGAFVAALSECVVAAGGDPASLMGAIEEESVEYATQADVVIVGAGGAGLMAALTAANDGASVILLEKSGVIGGNTLCAANGINAFDSQVQLADPDYQASEASFEHFEGLQTNERSHIELVDAFISNSAEAIDYLSGLGVDFTVEISHDDRNPTQNYYLLKSEADGTTTMTTIVGALNAALEQSDVKLYKNIQATELVQDDTGTVVGVKALDADGQELVFNATSVVLTTGGFGKNKELLAEVAPAYANCITDEMAPTTGDGLIMAREIGAQAVDLDQIQTFPSVIEGVGMSFPPGGFMVDGTIYVNNSGERFAAEMFEIPWDILAQDKGEAFAIFDTDNYDERMANYERQGIVKAAETATELGDELGFDGTGLEATLQQWNADAQNGGVDAAFGKENISPIEPTLYGYKFGVGAHYFMGGILIDETTRVLDESGAPIPGLYAAGEVTGGFHGTQRIDGSGTGDSIVFGLIAGHTVAAAV